MKRSDTISKSIKSWSGKVYNKDILPSRRQRICIDNIDESDKQLPRARKGWYIALLVIGVLAITCMVSLSPRLVCATIKQESSLCFSNSEGTYIFVGLVSTLSSIWGFCVALTLKSCLRRGSLDRRESQKHRQAIEGDHYCQTSRSDELVYMPTLEARTPPRSS